METTTNRITSVDLLKGLVMVIMALDHTRDYFHSAAFLFEPTDPLQSTLPIFFTRWITHFCAPAFSFLAGMSAYLSGRKKPVGELSLFLFTRGLWLVIMELTIVNFAWFFDIRFSNIGLFVIWSLGISMLVLAGLVHFSQRVILIFSVLLIFGHNLLDTFHPTGNVFWAIIHDGGFFQLSPSHTLFVAYPIVPWMATMSLGYYFGGFYRPDVAGSYRTKLFNRIGVVAILLFVLLRWINIYGDPLPWKQFDTLSQEIISFFNPTKYPPSLLYLLMTLGGTFLFLANSENLKGKIADFFSTFGRVPFFYYLLHLYLIHLGAVILAQLTGFGWQKMILVNWVTEEPSLKGYGVPLWGAYLVWLGIIFVAYIFCRKYDSYKRNSPKQWWHSYI